MPPVVKFAAACALLAAATVACWMTVVVPLIPVIQSALGL